VINNHHTGNKNENETVNSASRQTNFIPSNPEEFGSSLHSSSTLSIHANVQDQNMEQIAIDASSPANVIEQEKYEEDHADEERMFMEMNTLLTKLRVGLYRRKKLAQGVYKSAAVSNQSNFLIDNNNTSISSTKITKGQNIATKEPPQEEVKQISQSLEVQTTMLSKHLLEHLEKEENHCIPLVKEHLIHDEINDLVGRIMGKRSSDVMIQILNLAVNNLPKEDRESMVSYMKQAMVGTFFERWLSMGGYNGGLRQLETNSTEKQSQKIDRTEGNMLKSYPEEKIVENDNSLLCPRCEKKGGSIECDRPPSLSSSSTCSSSSSSCGVTTTQKELEKLIRAIAANPELTSIQKNTIQE